MLSANCQSLLLLPLLQIRLFIPQIVIRITHDALSVARFQLATKFAGGTHPQRSWFHDRFLRNQGSGGDDRTGPDARAIQDDRAHADQAAVFDGATMQRYRVAYRDVSAQ